MGRSESVEIWQPRCHGADFVEVVEQHCRRVPLAGQKPVAQCRRKRGREGERSGGDRARREVRGDRRLRRGLDQRLQAFDVGAGRHEAGHPEHGGVALEDLRKRFTDHGANARPYEALRRVLARGPAAEVRVDDENRGAGEARIVERMARVGPAIVLEQVALEAFERYRDEEPRRHDPVGVDVIAAQWQSPSLNDADGSRRSRSLGLGAGCHAGTPSSISRTSTTSPAIAAAATIAGLISSVRPVGLPCRPLKLRFDEDAEIWLPSRRSGFIPRHIEQPAPRHSKPAPMKISCSPRASASRRTARDPGTTSAFTWEATRWPRTIRAASSRSDRRPLVHEPMNATSMRVPCTRAPGRKPMNASASSFGSAAIGSDTATDWPGLMPQVTVGSIVDASNVTRSSYDAFASDAICRHQATARSNASPAGANGRPRRNAKLVSSGLT